MFHLRIVESLLDEGVFLTVEDVELVVSQILQAFDKRVDMDVVLFRNDAEVPFWDRRLCRAITREGL